MEIQSYDPLWSEQVKAKEAASLLTGNLKTRFNQDIQESNNGNKARKQYVVNKALALNSIPSP